MPIPAFDSQRQSETAPLYLIEHKPAEIPLSGVERRVFLRRRLLAFAMDLFVVQGFSLYFSQFFAMAMLRFHKLESFSRLGRNAGADLFFDAYDFSLLRVWLGCSVLMLGLYFFGTFLSFGKSLGAGLMGLELVNARGVKPTTREYARRMAGLFVSLLLGGLPLVRCYFSPGGAAPHDRWSETFVRIMK